MRRRVVEAFEEWTSERGALPEGADAVEIWRDRIGILLQGREDYLNCPDPTRWRSGDVHRLLMDHVVPRQVDAWLLAEQGVDILREFLLFLDRTERLHPGSTRVATVLKELDRVARQFPEAMADTSRFRLAKRVFTAMLADGLRPNSDQAQLDQWAERFNGLGAEGRRRVLGELMDTHPGYDTGALVIHGSQVAILKPGVPADKRVVWPDAVPCDCGCAEVGRPAQLPDDDTLARTASASAVLERLAALGEWVGEQGRPVDKRGELRRSDVLGALAALGVPDESARRMRDVPVLAELWDLAVELDVLAPRRTAVLPGATLPALRDALKGNAAPEQALELWDDVFDELVQPAVADADAERRRIREWTQPLLPRLLGMLCLDHPDDEFVEFAGVAAEVIEECRPEAAGEGPDLLASFAAMAMLNGLSRLAGHGAVEVDGPPTEDGLPATADKALRVLDIARWVVAPPDGLGIRLTGLGRRAVGRQVAEAHGAEAIHGAA